MNPMNPFAMVLAAPAAWRSLGLRFSGDYAKWQATDTIGFGLLAVTFVGGFWLLSRLAKWQADAASGKGRGLFTELCAAHRLTFRERRLCRQVAANAGLSGPEELFVSPRTHAAIAERNPDLADRLFGPGLD